MTHPSTLNAFAIMRESAADEERMNHGHDPFFQVSHAIAACPPPRGPLQTQAPPYAVAVSGEKEAPPSSAAELASQR
jgi:hypothetical protein